MNSIAFRVTLLVAGRQSFRPILNGVLPSHSGTRRIRDCMGAVMGTRLTGYRLFAAALGCLLLASSPAFARHQNQNQDQKQTDSQAAASQDTDQDQNPLNRQLPDK